MRMLAKRIAPGRFEKEKVEYENPRFPLFFLAPVADEYGLGFIPHVHDEIEFLFVERGTADIICSNKKYRASAGDIFVFNSGEIHSCLFADKEYRGKCIQFDKNLLNGKFIDACEYKYLKPVSDKRVVFKNYYKDEAPLIAIFYNVEREFEEKRSGWELAIKGQLYGFFAQLFRLNNIEAANTKTSEKNFDRVNFIIDYIAEHYTEKIDFKPLVKSMFLDLSYFSRVFKEQTGKSMVTYLNEFRITQALNLLTDSSKSITETAMLTGFDDVNYFSRTFKEIIGVPPTEIRNLKRE